MSMRDKLDKIAVPCDLFPKPRLVDVTKVYCAECEYLGRCEPMIEQKTLFCDVPSMPTVDAVPVVRCKDCKRQGNPIECPMCIEEFIDLPEGGWDTNIFDLAKDDGFCSYGERKDGEG